jgi:hypothetical protein
LTQEKGGFLLEVELGLEPCLCRFECDMCLCNCQATFNEDKQHTITKSLFKNSMQGEKVSSKFCKSKNKEGCSLFFNFVKSSLHNNSVREFQWFDSHSENKMVSDVLTKTAVIVATNSDIQANAHVMRGCSKPFD